MKNTFSFIRIYQIIFIGDVPFCVPISNEWSSFCSTSTNIWCFTLHFYLQKLYLISSTIQVLEFLLLLFIFRGIKYVHMTNIKIFEYLPSWFGLLGQKWFSKTSYNSHFYLIFPKFKSRNFELPIHIKVEWRTMRTFETLIDCFGLLRDKVPLLFWLCWASGNSSFPLPSPTSVVPDPTALPSPPPMVSSQEPLFRYLPIFSTCLLTIGTEVCCLSSPLLYIQEELLIF